MGDPCHLGRGDWERAVGGCELGNKNSRQLVSRPSHFLASILGEKAWEQGSSCRSLPPRLIIFNGAYPELGEVVR